MISPVRLLTVVLVLLIASCSKDNLTTRPVGDPRDVDGLLAREWFQLECTLVKETPGMFPPQAARAFGYTSLTLYETAAAGWPGAPSMAGQVNDLTTGMLPSPEAGKAYHWGIAANAAIADIIRQMFVVKITAENQDRVDELEAAWKSRLAPEVSDEVVVRSEAFGKAMAAAVETYASTDGGHMSHLDPFQLPYNWPAIVGAWVPTGAVPNPLSPRWGVVRPYLTVDVIGGQPAAHIPYDESPGSDFYNAAMDVYSIVKNVTPETKEIAQFWADDPFNTCTPTGHTFNILTQLLEEDDANLAKSAVAYAKLGMAEHDAFIACWKTKYDYFLIRPVSYIQQHIDASWQTLIGTPPFPAYTSGHATEAAAGSQVFIDMFTSGDGKRDFTDRTQLQFGYPPRHFDNFNDMALECANSRFYGGIHYNMDNLLGLDRGRQVGHNVVALLTWPTSFD